MQMSYPNSAFTHGGSCLYRRRRSTHHSAAQVHASAAYPEVERWQEKKLKEASALGRRHVQIKALCKETGLDRRVVIGWLKAKEEGSVRSVPSPVWLEASNTATESRQPNTAPELQRREQARNGAEPQVEGPKHSKTSWRFSKAAQATLEMVYGTTHHPRDEIVLSIVDLHNVPRRQVLDWFAERRRSGGAPAGGRKARVTR